MILEFDTKTIFAILSILISAIVFANYLYNLLKKRAKPHTYTWLIWLLTQGTAAVGLWYGGGGKGALALTLSTIPILIIFLLSLRYGTKNITLTDKFTLAFALLAILIWWQLDNPFLAILMVTIIDLVGYFPSWRKSVKEPWSEPILSWSISPVGHLLTIFALAEYNFYTVAYLMSLVIANFILVAICLVYRRKIPKPKKY